ncbi:hypothetical protein Hanom_Chr04g00340351 [Helianthus anomalus]
MITPPQLTSQMSLAPLLAKTKNCTTRNENQSNTNPYFNLFIYKYKFTDDNN